MAESKDQETLNIPWIEKYRPTHFDDIVLDPHNRQFFRNMLTYSQFPNLLFYGFPGSGKTSTIINLINEYQEVVEKSPQINKSNVIHLNASNDRGIDVVRDQIQRFVCSHNIFNQGLKFVVLDEVDYMTKLAQQSLKNLIQTSMKHVRFCLICNYICKIDDSLKQELICVRFNKLPKTEVTKFIQNIAQAEQLDIDMTAINRLHAMYQSDIRSMINFLQANQGRLEIDCIADDEVWHRLHGLLMGGETDMASLRTHICGLAEQYNMDVKRVIKEYYNYIVVNEPRLITVDYLRQMQLCLHDTDAYNQRTLIDFFIVGQRTWRNI